MADTSPASPLVMASLTVGRRALLATLRSLAKYHHYQDEE